MKYGRTLTELAQEIERQNNAKRDYLVDTTQLTMGLDVTGDVRLDIADSAHTFGLNEVAHQQIGQQMGIPLPYYRRMLSDAPGLLATNVNHWMRNRNEAAKERRRMVRTLDNTARAFLSDRYRRIDNYEIANIVLPILGGIKDVQIASCEVTDRKLYIKAVNPRLQADVTPGDVVQSGICITNSEVGLGSFEASPLVYRLVCSNGMVVNDAAQKRRHIGAKAQQGEDYALYADETIAADDRAFMLKVRDTVRSIVDATQFDKVVAMMQEAREAKITAESIPAFVELTAKEYAIGKKESESVLSYLIHGGDLSLYGLSNAVTRFSQDVPSYDRASELESIGYDVLSMPAKKWKQLNHSA